MEIKIVIDAPKGWKRRVLLYVVTPVALVAATALIARATVQNVDASWIQSGSQVSASDLSNDFGTVNANFTSLDQRITALEAFRTQATADGGYSLGATYCGLTTGTTGAFTSGALVGYAAARPLCQTACGATTAHMCVGDEIVRTYQLGKSIPVTGWYSGGVSGYSPTTGAEDCTGWTEAAQLGAAWSANGTVGNPSLGNCSTSQPILCCN